MDSFAAKVTCGLLVAVLGLFFGFLPRTLRSKFDQNEGGGHLRVLSLLLNFGGGVLLANSFCHWLPEVREGKKYQTSQQEFHIISGIEHKNIDTVLPLAEVIMLAGFSLVCVCEEVIHFFLSKHCHNHIIDDGEINGEKKGKQWANKVTPSTNQHLLGDKKDQHGEDTRTMSAVRTSFVVLALSFHSVVEGLALSLERDANGVWMNFGALATHKFVIAFAVGVELLSAQVKKS